MYHKLIDYKGCSGKYTPINEHGQFTLRSFFVKFFTLLTN